MLEVTMVDSIIVAVDPGANGGIAWFDPLTHEPHAAKMPTTADDVVALLRSIMAGHPENAVAYIEKVSGYIPGASGRLFEFGRQVERPGAILAAFGVRRIEVTPQRWQKALSLGDSGRKRAPSAPRGATDADKEAFRVAHADEIKALKSSNARLKKEWKNKLKSEAQRRFPGLDITLSTCDALLILSYAEMCERG